VNLLNLEPRPFPVVLAAPSGAGKTSLAQALVERNRDVVFSISATTRPPRAHEVDARDYFFVDDARFDRMIADGELVEWAEVHGRRYGTPRAGIEQELARGHTVLLDIDVQGARQIRAAFKEAVLIFLLPPSAEELGRRLTGRASEGRAEQVRRLDNARCEIREAGEFDYVVVNADFAHSIAALEGILASERMRVARMPGIKTELHALDSALGEILERSR
jgi:guanylate kinase